MFYGKNTFRMQLQDYIKTMMLDFINNRSKSKSNSAFLALKQFIYGMMNKGMSREVGCLNSLVSHFFIEKI